MGKTYYCKEWKTYVRKIKINGVPTFVAYPFKEHLDKLPYNLCSQNTSKENKNGN